MENEKPWYKNPTTQKIVFIILICVYGYAFLLYEANAHEDIQQYPERKEIAQVKPGLSEAETKEETSAYQPRREEQSDIEKMFNFRSDSPLQQFGYNFFKKEVVYGFLPVGDEYTVGPGDTLAIYFWGDPVDILGLKSFYTLTIDREGKIFVPNLGVFYVWSLNVGQTKAILYKAMAKKFKRFEIEVTLGKLREFPVYVSGYVKQPGLVSATGVSTVLDVLTSVGGIEKNGSLRDIVLKRKEKNKIREIRIDLYDLLVHGEPVEIRVKEGDSILVNSVGKTSGISGGIKRPAIYELSREGTIKDLIDLSGGVLPSAYSTGVKLIRYEEDTLKIYEGNLKDEDFLNSLLNDGDFVLVEGVYDQIENKISVQGHVAYAGKYSFTEGMKLSYLLGKVGILPDTDMSLAEIRREEQNEVINFSPKAIQLGENDVVLEKRDIITFYPERVYKPVQVAGEVENPLLVPYYPEITLLDALTSADFKLDIKSLKAEVYRKEKEVYRVVYLYDLMMRGVKTENVSLAPGDRILIKSIEKAERSAVVTVLGEVKNPGVYEYRQGMKLYNILLESGGYTENAYPYGLIYIKKSAEKLQQEQIDFIFLTLEEYLLKKEESSLYISEASQEEKDVLKLALLKHRQLLENLRKRSQFNLGRISLNIPDTLEELQKSPDNIEIDEGDYIYVPRTPNHILVLGDVYNQISLPFREKNTVQKYIREVGGFTKNSDKRNIYIIKANGKVVSQRQYSSGKFFNLKLDRGDTVVIPSKMRVPVVWSSLLKDTTQIIFQAISTVALVMSL